MLLFIPYRCGNVVWLLVHTAKAFSTALLLALRDTMLAANVIYDAAGGGHCYESAANIVLLITFNQCDCHSGGKTMNNRSAAARRLNENPVILSVAGEY